ncbi:MAG TPA: phosphoadenylyl-sulfate reductase [Terriglobales bacterium]|nr:phosphoadenylyl-sulfate reductase [Terriglobales bacterium]
MTNDLGAIQEIAEGWRPEQVLRWSFENFGAGVQMASGFGAEGMALIDMASRLTNDLRVFTIDTGFLFPETYELIETVERRYGISVERVHSRLNPEEQSDVYGPELWTVDPDQCCAIRKVEPLKKKLSTLNAWITAIRRDQTAVRASARKVEWDRKFQLAKINPIADWSNKDVWNYLFANNVPYNRLHDRNYTSIGCTHCTRAIRAGEDPRAGRWSGFQKTECGLHVADQPAATTPAALIQIGLATDPEPNCC